MPVAVEIQPLKREQVGRYLVEGGEQLEVIRRAVKSDAKVGELLDTPLMLGIAMLAYQELPEPESPRNGDSASQLFWKYIDAMFKRRGGETQYSRNQTLRWLRWLADVLTRKEQILFQLENLRPDWLPTQREQRAATRSTTLFGGLLGGLLFGLFGGLLFGLGFGKTKGPVDTMRWSWPSAKSELLGGLLFGLLFGLFVALLVALDKGGAFSLQHLFLRLLIWQKNYAPWNYIHFLDYATDCLFLRKVGGGYIFVHRMLREYFAELTDEDIRKLSG